MEHVNWIFEGAMRGFGARPNCDDTTGRTKTKTGCMVDAVYVYVFILYLYIYIYILCVN
jgi:hypothetical protein